MGLLNMTGKGLELTSMADIPAGTGLGSSGSFTTALLKALHTHNKHLIHPQQLAEQACHIEIDRLREPIGKQDQYISAYGGLTCFEFHKDGAVKAWPLGISPESRYNLEDSLVLFFTGYSRNASSILADQQNRTEGKDKSMIDNLHFIKNLGERSKQAIERGNLKEFGQLMHEHWEHKRRRSNGMSNPRIDECYEVALRNGAIGGKLIGAGGGGFLMFYTEDKIRLRHVLREMGLTEVRFRFDFEGTKVVV
jgi:D-glycero-alpha-D-manno-heptose-7-phosphate kinase